MTKTTTEAFDFASLDLSKLADVPHEIEIVFPPMHPREGDGMGVFVSVIGAESATFQSLVRSEANRVRLEEFQKRRGGPPKQPMTVEEEEDKIIEFVAHAVKGWRTVIDGKSEPVILLGGEKIEYSHAAVVRWLKQFAFVREQINRATADLSNFIKA